MYQVISLYGDFEPWWFLEDWKEDITAVKEFKTFKDAEKFYLQQWQRLKVEFPKFESQSNYLATFWDENELRWCEECSEDLQQYCSILLLKDNNLLAEEFYNSSLAQTNAQPRQLSSCRLSI